MARMKVFFFSFVQFFQENIEVGSFFLNIVIFETTQSTRILKKKKKTDNNNNMVIPITPDVGCNIIEPNVINVIERDKNTSDTLKRTNSVR